MLSAFINPNDPTTALLGARRRYQHLDLNDHLAASTPKRILSLDGGGVRTAMSIAILQKIETLLRKRHGNHKSFRLGNYFDLVGGSSTGAIVATLIAANNYNVADIRDSFTEIASHIYRGKGWGILRAQEAFDSKHLQTALSDVFGTAALGDKRITTGLAVLARRVDTDETLIYHNNPRGSHFDNSVDDGADDSIGYRHYPITSILRAATGVPENFAPKLLELLPKPHQTSGLFVDGSVTPHNNPAFQLYLLSTLKDMGFEWSSGSENLHIISIGTGSLCNRIAPTRARRMAPRRQNREALTALMDGAEHTGDMMMQLLSEAESPVLIDKSLGNLRNKRLTEQPKFSYQRYQTRLELDVLREQLGLGLTARQLSKVRTMSDPDGLQIAYEIGQAVADKLIKEEHFPAVFDLPQAASLSALEDNASPTDMTQTNMPAYMPKPNRPLAPSVRTRIGHRG